MAFLSKADILAMVDSTYEVVTVPEWNNQQVRVRSLTGAEKTILRERGEKSPSWDGLVCAMGIVDEHGANLFTPDEVTVLAKKHPFVLEQIARVICRLSVMTDEARDEAEKKRNPIQTSSGGTSSPEPSTPATDSTLTA
jgi:hypothetical protein